MGRHNAFDTINSSDALSNQNITHSRTNYLYNVSSHHFNDDLIFVMIMHILSMAITISSGYQGIHSIPGICFKTLNFRNCLQFSTFYCVFGIYSNEKIKRRE